MYFTNVGNDVEKPLFEMRSFIIESRDIIVCIIFNFLRNPIFGNSNFFVTNTDDFLTRTNSVYAS